ncbi:MAG: PEP-CTERM sorting domain-containing protein [Rubrivivax sp.]|nr:MAG: PEP-CTERM sorting domain-containing protein [Rubrivivax sp.]
MDYAELSLNFLNSWSASSLVLTGSLLGGGTVSQTLLLDGLNDGPGGATDFETAVLDAFWSTSDLVSLQFAGFIGADDNHAFQVDNIALDVTRGSELPEPGSLALGALALAAAWRTRRATARAAQQAA